MTKHSTLCTPYTEATLGVHVVTLVIHPTPPNVVRSRYNELSSSLDPLQDTRKELADRMRHNLTGRVFLTRGVDQSDLFDGSLGNGSAEEESSFGRTRALAEQFETVAGIHDSRRPTKESRSPGQRDLPVPRAPVLVRHPGGAHPTVRASVTPYLETPETDRTLANRYTGTENVRARRTLPTPLAHSCSR